MTDQGIGQLRTWQGVNPTHCQTCANEIKHQFIDGKTTIAFGGRWAIMCVPCHSKWGIGLGRGRGQKYRREAHRPGLRPNDVFVKVNSR